MTHAGKPSIGAGFDPADASRAGAPRDRLALVPFASLLALAVLLGVDVVSDARAGSTPAHLGLEVAVVVAALAGAAGLLRQLLAERGRARALKADLRAAEASLARFREEAQDHVRGLAAAIDRQLGRWELSPAEREIALLLLKGLSLKEIADVRATSERTVRQQALAVYRKAGLGGRAELAAFFLEDLLVPPKAPGPSA